ncbi:hypothetical protein HH310_17455 [Actinoplanes sp. TBRC 11911]|uniref:fibronectin type III domain-containing protein n=1 Tax=Actinoplanes sp. TBRC 11911 TaxID=2729386 RepID=UPI00145C8E0F|nr:fibronectin type III domain-containing protein [Actinoplanes sp. TBRC 11911]NMO52973.1 hypothetical protein [Actinoplanes sp. TBRC 11911]
MRAGRSFSRWALAAATVMLSAGTVLANPLPAAADPISSPASVTLTPGRRMIKVEWTAPVNPASPVTAYTATASTGESCSSATLTCNITPVAANTPITVGVVACPANSADCSAPTAAAAAVKAGPPAAPSVPTVVFQDSPTKMRLTWTDNDPGAGIGSYKLTATPADGLTGTCAALVTVKTCDYETLTVDTAYTFRVTAIGVSNSTGTTGTSPAGPASAAKTAGPPHQPAKPSVARVSNTAVTVSFAKPGGGQTLSGYTVSGTGGKGCTAAPDETECTATGLDPNTAYTFTVVAKGENTAAGDSTASAASDPITPGKIAALSAPTVELGAQAGQVTVRWDPADTTAGGTPATYSVVSQATDGGTSLTDCTGVGAGVTSCDYSGLQNGKKYKFKVTATNGAGTVESAWSDEIVSQLPAIPGTPTATLGNAPGKVTLNWPAASGGGPVVFYNVTATPAGGTNVGTKSAGCGFNLTTPTCEITGLSTNTSYTFTVTAVGDLGTATSAASNSIVADAPGAPQTPAVALTGNSGEANVTWTAPNSGGTVASYTATATPAGGSAITTGCSALSAATLSCLFTGLDTTKVHTFTVQAANTAGHNDVTAVGTQVPNAPTSVAAALGGSAGDATVTWSAPGSGPTPGRYVVTATSSDGSTQAACTSSPCAITGLDPTKSYTFTVRAQNLLGGTSAAPTGAVVSAAPGAPQNVTATVTDDGEVTVNWTKSITGGAVEHYVVASSSCTNVAPRETGQCVITGLDASPHTFTVSAVNNIGSTPAPATAPVVAAAADAPTDVNVALGNEAGKVIVSWTAASTGGTATTYSVTGSNTASEQIPGTCASIAAPTTTCTLTGLRSDVAYTFTVAASNDAGGDDFGPTDPIILAAPGVPTTVQAALVASTPGSVTVTWGAPVTGGVPTEYSVKPVAGASTPAECTKAANATKSCTFSGLTTSATYTFEVRATNAAGPSTAATTSSIVPNAPGAATNLVVTLEPTPGNATVTWDAPAAASAAVTTYEVSASSLTGGAATPTPCSVAGNATKTCTLTGMTTSAAYTFKVRAVNAAGGVDATTTSTIVPNLAGAPTGVQAVLGNVPGKAVVTWTAPTDLGPALSYTVTPAATDASTPPAACNWTPGTPLSCTFEGLDVTKSYTFVVRAFNPSGGTDAAATTAIKPNKPGLPTGVTAARVTGAGNATVSWSEPTDLGVPVSYLVTATPAGGGTPTTCTKAAGQTTCALSSLDVTKQYTFKVKAINPSGDSEASAAETFIPNTPAKPANVVVAPDNTSPGKVTVTWDQPAGADVTTGWRVTATSPDGGTLPAACTVLANALKSCVFTGLTTVASYSFTVRATNEAGDSDSDATQPVVPNRPTAPAAPTAQPIADNTARITWTAPTGGSKITSYTATAYTVSAPQVAVSSTPCTNVTGLTCDFGGLLATETYTFAVTANGPGGSAAGERSAAVIMAGPGKPGTPAVELAGPDAVRVTWTGPTSGGPVTGYSVTSSPDLSAPARCTGTLALSCVFDRLASGTSYTFTVVAAGSAGRTAASDPSVAIVPGLPGRPGRVTAAMVTGDDTKVRVSWTAPSGGQVTGYTVRGYTAGAPDVAITSAACTGVTAVTCDFSGVMPTETYTFTVTATGPAGTAVSERSAAIITGGPGKPGTPAVELAGSTGVKVTWTAASGPVTGYSVTANPDVSAPARCTGTLALSCVFDRLTSGVSYTFTVTAAGSAGRSTPSEPSASITIPLAPGMPERVTATPTDTETQVLVSWQPPSRGGPVAGYVVESMPGALGCTEPAEVSSCTVTVDPKTAYRFRVKAVGASGVDSSFSAPTAEVVTGSPGKPGTPAVDLTGPNAVTVSWDAPAGGGPVTGYTVVSSPRLSAPVRCTDVLANSCVFDRLASGTSYTFTVVATGAAGRVTPSDPSEAVTPGAPGVPEQVTAALTGDGVLVSWQAPAAGGDVAGYAVESSPGQFKCSAEATMRSCLVSGLDPKTGYTFRVKALGASVVGDSAFSPATAAITPGAPAAPTDVAVAAGNGQIAVSWTASEGPVDHYVARTSTGGRTCMTTTADSTECVISGLTNLTTYAVTVVAVGTNGVESAASEPSARVRPTAGAPGSPAEVTAVARDKSAVVSWKAPTTGSAVARYEVTAVSTTGSRTCLTEGTALTCTVDGLTNGTAYSVTVVAIGRSASGYSAPSTAVPVTPRAAPSTPVNVSVASGVKSLVVKWTAGAGTEPVSSFVASTGGTTPQTCNGSSTATTCTISNVTPGLYPVSVVANGTVSGVTSAPSEAVTGRSLLALAPTLGSTAPTATGTLTVSSTSGKIGSTVTVSGNGYAPYTEVALGLYTPLVKLGTATTDDKGNFVLDVTIPAGTTTGAKTLIAGGLPPTGSTLRYSKVAFTVNAT